MLGQGFNNNYEIDSEDLKNVFETQGIHVFKYPFEIKKGEYISISYEVFKNGSLEEKKHLIEEFQIDNNIKINHHIARNDTVIFHRFYFFEKDGFLTMKQVLPGIAPIEKIDIKEIENSSFNSRIDIPKDLSKKESLMFYYGNKSKGWLNCSSGIAKVELINRYDLVIIFYAEKIDKERTKTILEEIKDNLKNKK